MKKLYFLAVAVLMTMMVSCNKEAETTDAQSENPEEKATCEQQQPADMQAIVLGRNLALYGYEYESPEALIEAANILMTVQTAELDAPCTIKTKDNAPAEDTEEETEQPRSFAPADLIAAARQLAGEDALLLAMIQKSEERLAATASAERGSTYGVRTLEKHITRGNYHEYEIEFQAGELAICAVVGDGSTDLDLYICDKDMNLVVEDVDYTDNCYCSWTPTETATYVIRIYNRGDKTNYYSIFVN